MVEDIPESNFNLRKLLEPLKLEEINYKITFDLKAANCSFGLSAHSGKFSCLYCEGECSMEKEYLLRSLGSLDQHYEDFVRDEYEGIQKCDK